MDNGGHNRREGGGGLPDKGEPNFKEGMRHQALKVVRSFGGLEWTKDALSKQGRHRKPNHSGQDRKVGNDKRGMVCDGMGNERDCFETRGVLFFWN